MKMTSLLVRVAGLGRLVVPATRFSINSNPSGFQHQVMTNTCSMIHVRGMRRWQVATLRYMGAKRKRLGPETPRHRSAWQTWNYNCELYAFGKRLGEEFREETLRVVFTHKSYLEQEEKRRLELGVSSEEAPLDLKDNSEHSKAGEYLMSSYIRSYLRHCYPFLPEEGVSAVHDHLMSDDVLSHVAKNIGISDLIMCTDFPPEKSTLSSTLKAVIGAIKTDQNAQRAELFVQDFVLTQLVAKDILDLWEIPDPMALLNAMLRKDGKGPPEPRLLREAASGTILATYVVGLYVDKELIAHAPGETLAIAQEMAALEALRRMFCLTVDRDPLPLGKKGRQLQISVGNQPKLHLTAAK